MTLHWTTTTLWFYTDKLKRLYSNAKIGIETQIASQGRYTKLLKDSQGNQRFGNTVHNGIAIEVGNILPYEIAWSDLEDLLKGLSDGPEELRLCGRFLCEFAFSLGHGPHVGRGRTYRQRWDGYGLECGIAVRKWSQWSVTRLWLFSRGYQSVWTFKPSRFSIVSYACSRSSVGEYESHAFFAGLTPWHAPQPMTVYTDVGCWTLNVKRKSNTAISANFSQVANAVNEGYKPPW